MSTVDGRCGKSPAKRRAPRTRFRPPWSTVSLITAGFDHGKLLGASASSDVAGGEARLALAAPVEVGVGDQAVDGSPTARWVCSSRRNSQLVSQRRVGEAAVAPPGRSSERPRGDPRQLGAEARGAAGGAVGPPREAGGDADGGAGADEPRAARRAPRRSASRPARRSPPRSCRGRLRPSWWSSAPHLRSLSRPGHGSESRPRARRRVIPCRTPTFAAGRCEPTTTRGRSRLVEERADRGRRVLGLVEQEQVPAARDDVQPRVREPRGEQAAVARAGRPGRPRPTTTSVGWRTRCSHGRLDQPADRVELVGVAERRRRMQQPLAGVRGRARRARAPCARPRCAATLQLEQPRVVVARRASRASAPPSAAAGCRRARARSRTGRAGGRARARGARAPARARRRTSSRARRRARARARRAAPSRRARGRTCAAAGAAAARAPRRAGRTRSARARRRAPANGAHMSRCAPMPVISSSGGPSPWRADAQAQPAAVTYSSRQPRGPRPWPSCGGPSVSRIAISRSMTSDRRRRSRPVRSAMRPRRWCAVLTWISSASAAAFALRSASA